MHQKIQQSHLHRLLIIERSCRDKKDYAKEMVTGFIRLNGQTVGVVANRSKVYGADAETEG